MKLLAVITGALAFSALVTLYVTELWGRWHRYEPRSLPPAELNEDRWTVSFTDDIQNSHTRRAG